MGIILQTFTPNYFATCAAENCELLLDQLFASKWFELENSEQKGALLFMTRITRPLVIRAGRFFQMNINTFLKVISVYILKLLN